MQARFMGEARCVTPLHKVMPGADLDELNAGADAERRFPGERVAVQIAYRAVECPEYDRMECTVAVRTGLEDVRVFLVRDVPCDLPAYPGADGRYLLRQSGMAPDRLEEVTLGRQCARFLPGRWQTVWVEASVPSDGPVPEYPLIVEFLEPNGRPHASAECRVVVDPALCAGGKGFAHSEWLHPDLLAEYYGVEMWSEAHWDLLEAFIAPMRGWGIDTLLTPLLTPSLDVAPGASRDVCQLVDVIEAPDCGGYEFGFARLERWLLMARRCGIETIEFAPLYRQWTVDGPTVVLCGGRAIFGADSASEPKLAEYADFLGQLLPRVVAVLRRTGWSDHAFLHVSDEPYSEAADSYRAAVSTVRAAVGDEIPVRDACGDAGMIRDGIVEHPIVGLEAIEEAYGAEWAYLSCAHGQGYPNCFIAMSGSRTRILGALLFHHRLTGLLHWGYNFWKSQFSRYLIDPYRVTDADRAFPSGDPFLVYPGRDGRPVPSLRLHYLRQAADDYRLLSQAADATSFEAVDRALLAAAGGHLDWRNYPETPGFFASLREVAAAALDRVAA